MPTRNSFKSVRLSGTSESRSLARMQLVDRPVASPRGCWFRSESGTELEG